MKLRYLLFISFFLTLSFWSKAQDIAVGTWRVHFSFYTINNIAESKQYIYAASDNGLFRINKENKQSQIISRIQGLNDSRISQIAYHNPSQTVVIAYESGNIDLIRDDEIINIDDILISNSITGDKRINQITFFEEFAFLACEFGVVKLNLDRLEISEDYRNLSFTNSSTISVSSIALDQNNDSIFLSTSQGIMKAALSPSVNLQDVNNWQLFDTAQGLSQEVYSSVLSHDGSIFTFINLGDTAYFYEYRNANWQLRFKSFGEIQSLQSTGEKMVLIRNGRIELWNDRDTISRVIQNQELFPEPGQFIESSNGEEWISSPETGLFNGSNGNYQYLSPNGPFKDFTARMHYYKNKIVVAPGGRRTNFTQLNRDDGFFVFENGIWTNYLPKNIPETERMEGIYVQDLYEPFYYRSGGFLAIGSIGYGILAQHAEDSFSVFNQNNSTLFNLLDGFPSTRVTALAEDSEGNLIVGNAQAPRPINIYNPENGWSQYPNSFGNLNRLDQMVIDSDDNLWCRMINLTGGMVVVNLEENRSISLNSNQGTGNLPDNSVNDMAIDLDGDIWVGTNDGVAVFFNPDRIFDNNGIEASTPIFENRPLLREEIITAIEVDPGNRKWIGTNNGVWLFEPDGTTVVANFTESNSPLLSNEIVDIEVNEQNGEVFFATSKGIISYRGTATAASNSCDDIKVFPNPVKPGYNGFLSVYGVPNDGIVKITDINGVLYFEGRAQGGSISWDLRNYNNEKPKTGVYLVLSSSELGEDNCISKFAIIE